MLVDELEEAVEDGLFVRTRLRLLVGLPVVELVGVVHECSDECRDGGPVVVGLTYDCPQRVEDAACNHQILVGNR